MAPVTTVARDKVAPRYRIGHDLLSSDRLKSGAIDALVLSTLEDKTLRRRLRQLEKLELAQIWLLTQKTLLKHKEEHQSITALALHQRLLAGLSGESLLVSSSMFLDTLLEVERFFQMSFKTIKSRLGQTLDTSTSELAMRAARVSVAAAEVLGGFEAARRYLRTRNFALGGSTPLDLLKTAEGERLVMNELQAQAEGGPL